MSVQDGGNSLYDEAGVKVLHLLKQPTQDNPSMPKLVDWLVENDKLGRKFMYRLALRSYAMQNDFCTYEEGRGASDEAPGQGAADVGHRQPGERRRREQHGARRRLRVRDEEPGPLARQDPGALPELRALRRDVQRRLARV